MTRYYTSHPGAEEIFMKKRHVQAEMATLSLPIANLACPVEMNQCLRAGSRYTGGRQAGEGSSRSHSAKNELTLTKIEAGRVMGSCTVLL